MRCIKSILLHFGQLMKSTSTKTSRTGRNSTPMKNISSKMCWPFLPPVMESWWKTFLSNSAPKFRSQKQDVSMDSKLPWKTFIQRHILSWLILTSRIKMKKLIFLTLYKILMWLKKKLNGLWNGWTNKNHSMKDWSLLPPFKEFSSQDHFAQFSGSKRGLSCLVLPFLMNSFQETKVYTLILHATFTLKWRTS